MVWGVVVLSVMCLVMVVDRVDVGRTYTPEELENYKGLYVRDMVEERTLRLVARLPFIRR